MGVVTGDRVKYHMTMTDLMKYLMTVCPSAVSVPFGGEVI